MGKKKGNKNQQVQPVENKVTLLNEHMNQISNNLLDNLSHNPGKLSGQLPNGMPYILDVIPLSIHQKIIDENTKLKNSVKELEEKLRISESDFKTEKNINKDHLITIDKLLDENKELRKYIAELEKQLQESRAEVKELREKVNHIYLRDEYEKLVSAIKEFNDKVKLHDNSPNAKFAEQLKDLGEERNNKHHYSRKTSTSEKINYAYMQLLNHLKNIDQINLEKLEDEREGFVEELIKQLPKFIQPGLNPTVEERKSIERFWD